MTDLLNARQAAEFLGLSKSAIITYAQKNIIPSRRAENNQYRFDADKLAAWQKNRPKPGGARPNSGPKPKEPKEKARPPVKIVSDNADASEPDDWTPPAPPMNARCQSPRHWLAEWDRLARFVMRDGSVICWECFVMRARG